MNKEEMLIDNYSLLVKDIDRNRDALVSAIQQLTEMNPCLGINLWEKTIRDNITEISNDFYKEEFDYENPGYVLVFMYELNICSQESFVNAIELFAKNNYLLDVIYAKSPITQLYFSGIEVISYLIRNNRLQEADNILSAIYKNKTYNNYSELWENIIDQFENGTSFYPGSGFRYPIKPSKPIIDFCISWIERIKDDSERAGAMTFALQLC